MCNIERINRATEKYNTNQLLSKWIAYLEFHVHNLKLVIRYLRWLKAWSTSLTRNVLMFTRICPFKTACQVNNHTTNRFWLLLIICWFWRLKCYENELGYFIKSAYINKSDVHKYFIILACLSMRWWWKGRRTFAVVDLMACSSFCWKTLWCASVLMKSGWRSIFRSLVTSPPYLSARLEPLHAF